MVNEFPCPRCGAKKRFHKKGCTSKIQIDVVTDLTQPLGGVVAVATIVSVNPEIIDFKSTLQGHSFNCCNTLMRRTNGAPYDAMCRHGRLLTADCSKCRQEHNGVLIYRCQLCGREVKDAPHLAQGNEAEQANSQVRG